MNAKNTPTNITLDLTALNNLLTKKGKVTVTELAAFYKTGKRALRAELKTLKEKGLVSYTAAGDELRFEIVVDEEGGIHTPGEWGTWTVGIDVAAVLQLMHKRAQEKAVSVYNSKNDTKGWTPFDALGEMVNAYSCAIHNCNEHGVNFDKSIISTMYGRLMAAVVWHAAHQGISLEDLVTQASRQSEAFLELSESDCDAD